jgi:DsbC/DsbD-like thiol-disulfide interchange protein
MLRVILTFIMLCTISNLANANNAYQFEIKKTDNILFLELDLKEGDYIYWKHSGQVGKSSAISLDSLSNIKSYDIKWPFPTIKIENNNISYIYQGKVSIPIFLNIENIHHKAYAKIDIDYAICNKEECKPISQMIEESFIAHKIDDYNNYNDYKVTYIDIKQKDQDWKIIQNF